MLLTEPAHEAYLPLAISLASVVWLGACAWFDLRTRRVPNWLTLPAIPLALAASWLAHRNPAESPARFLVQMGFVILPLIIAWYQHLLGGADLKILLALSLADPRLPVAAWMGAVLYFSGLLILQNSRTSSFAGVPGFALGAGVFALAQLALVLSQALVA
jgi:Flp pilus assembly protein protease CpaA